MKYSFLTIPLFLFLYSLEGKAQTVESAWQKHNEGRFFQSMEEALMLGSADGYALAARSRLILVRFYLSPDERLSNIEKAIEEAEMALSKDPPIWKVICKQQSHGA